MYKGLHRHIAASKSIFDLESVSVLYKKHVQCMCIQLIVFVYMDKKKTKKKVLKKKLFFLIDSYMSTIV